MLYRSIASAFRSGKSRGSATISSGSILHARALSQDTAVADRQRHANLRQIDADAIATGEAKAPDGGDDFLGIGGPCARLGVPIVILERPIYRGLGEVGVRAWDVSGFNGSTPVVCNGFGSAASEVMATQLFGVARSGASG